MSEQPFPVTVHPYPVGRNVTEYTYELGTSTTPARNALVFIGGLGDGPQTVGYIRTVAKKLEEAQQLGYSVFEARLSSAYTGFGYSSLAKDVKEISALVGYLRGLGKEKIVLMGHSTGGQVCMPFGVDPSRARREGWLLGSGTADTAQPGLLRVQ